MNHFHSFFCRTIVLLAALLSPVYGQRLPTLLYDMGTDQSPVAPGYTRVTPGSVYSEQTGYGWINPGQRAIDVGRPTPEAGWEGPAGQVIPRSILIYKEHSDLTRDAVVSKDDLVFQVRVPNGTYRVALTLGDLSRPICSEQVYVNDVQVGKDVDAKHIVRRGFADAQYGFPRGLRVVARVTGGLLRIRVAGDDSGFRERFLREYEKPGPISYLTGEPVRDNKPPKPNLEDWGNDRKRNGDQGGIWVWEDIGGPFTENSIMALEVYPFAKPPLWMERQTLAVTLKDAQLEKAVALFNSARFAESEKAFDEVKDDYARALGYLWLAGRPQYEEEERLVPKSLALLEKVAPTRKSDLMFAEILENARRIDKAIYRFLNRAKRQRTYNELEMISGEISSMQPEDPTYYKGLIYAGRGLYMVIPHRWSLAAGAGRQLFEKVRAGGFGDNRFVKWYLEDQWSEHQPDWIYRDYSALKKGAPAWAAEVYDAFNRELDLSEWWIRNRQATDGSLGGGWGDDVEILRSFGTFGSICPDASEIILEGTRKVAEGAWNSGSIDQEAGYFASVGDTEHSGEWTADTLVPMIRIDYGNPVYLERGLKTGRLMRDLWMDSNSRGQYLMRSNLLGALGVGEGDSQNDSRINFRPAQPARAVLWYNALPSLQKLFQQWADAWLEASLSTDRGKPRGVIPQEIAWSDGQLGGVKSPSWFRASHERGTVNYDWEGAGGYHDFVVDLFLSAFEATGDRKYLEPMELEAAYVTQHCPPQFLTGARAANAAAVRKLEEGSPEWIGASLAEWHEQWEKIRKIRFPEEFTGQSDLWTLQDVAKQAQDEAGWAQKRWPHVTTECIATDRVFWPGMGNALRIMTGTGILGTDPVVTYRGLGREFAAALLTVNDSALRLVIFNLSQATKSTAIIPWLLETGAQYELKLGPDADSDGRLDKVSESRTVSLEYRGQEVAFQLPSRTQYVVEMRKIGESGRPPLAPDVALSPADIRFVPDYHQVEVAVHNVGAVAAKGVVVALYAGEREIGRQRIPNVDAPADFDPEVVRVSFSFQPVSASETFKAVLDPEGSLKEITKRNNQAVRLCDTPSVAPRQHSSP